jgi:hypothetical protein
VVARERDPIGILRFGPFRQIAENPSREFSIVWGHSETLSYKN